MSSILYKATTLMQFNPYNKMNIARSLGLHKTY